MRKPTKREPDRRAVPTKPEAKRLVEIEPTKLERVVGGWSDDPHGHFDNG